MCLILFFFFKQKTAYEMRISDWSSDVCSSDLRGGACPDKSNLMLGIEVIEIHRQLHCVSGSAMVSQPGGPTVYLPSMAFMWELFGKFQWRSQPNLERCR